MTKKEMLAMIVGKLAETLADTGFRKHGRDVFQRKFPGGWQKIGIPLLDYNPIFKFSLTLCTRLEAAEAIFHRFSGSPPQYRALGTTTITRLNYFVPGPNDFKVQSAEDVDWSFVTINLALREKILPFFEKNQDAVSLDYSVNILSPGIDITQNPSGAMSSVILAHLAGNPRIDELIARHRIAMGLEAQTPHPFNSLVQFIRDKKE